ncbi:hypothetical protein RP20_CCG026793 [Aedes albopictus]|nr:hypothetical protein RP20_CCG026793 [Aedes albopictus]
MDASKLMLERLINANYEAWRFRIEMLLIREGLWKHISEEVPNPVTSEWKQGDDKARATIALFVEDNQHSIFRDCRTARETWEALKKHHQSVSLTSRVTLLKRICQLQFRDGNDMEQHLQEMDGLIFRLLNAGQKLDSQLMVAMVLRTLPESYATLTCYI